MMPTFSGGERERDNSSNIEIGETKGAEGETLLEARRGAPCALQSERLGIGVAREG